MDREQWARVKEIFNGALEREPAARAAFVAEAAAGDDEVRAEAERLLDAQTAAAGFIERAGAPAVMTGRVISHYEIGPLLGTGGMGRVYAARDIELGREVALKVASFDSEDAQARLRREAQHASRLSHPNICHVYDVGRADGQLFVVMELIKGQPLSDLVREGPLSIANARRYGMEIADALAHAHEHGVTHRDLKSTNVLITPKRGAKVLDFGLARTLDTHQIDAISHSQRSLTDEGMIAGTLPYMAPELLRGQRGDQRSDIWALGVLLYEMVAGRRPFTGVTGFEVSAAVLHQEPGALRAGVPAPLRAIIQRCLEKNSAKRYQNAADVYSALERMKGLRTFPRLRIPAFPSHLARNSLLFVAGLAAAAFVAYAINNRIGSRTPGNGASNARGYSLLGGGEFDQALEQFQAAAARSPHEANPWDSLGEGYLANGMPEKSLEAYSRALAVEPSYEPSILGRGLALAALGRYDEALEKASPDFRVQAFLLSRAGRYREAAALLEMRQADAAREEDAEAVASALLTSSWLLIEQKQYARALEIVRGAEMAAGPLSEGQKRPLLVLADLFAGIAHLGEGDVRNAESRVSSQTARYEADNPIEANWNSALIGEIALAQGRYDEAASAFKTAQKKSWQILGRDEASQVFAINLPSRDGVARVEAARGNRAAAIGQYRGLTEAGPARRTSAALEPRYVLALARLLREEGDAASARVEYERFLKLWAKADASLPELIEAKQALAQ